MNFDEWIRTRPERIRKYILGERYELWKQGKLLAADMLRSTPVDLATLKKKKEGSMDKEEMKEVE